MKKMKRFLLLLFMCCLVSSNASNESIVKAKTSGDWWYIILEDGTIRIEAYSGSETNIIIPSSIDGRKVTVIGETLLSAKEGGENVPYIESVVIPEGITTIEGGRVLWLHSFDQCNDSRKCNKHTRNRIWRFAVVKTKKIGKSLRNCKQYIN